MMNKNELVYYIAIINTTWFNLMVKINNWREIIRFKCYFKKIKQYKQVIIVSHDANLVINVSSEQVIIARNNDGV